MQCNKARVLSLSCKTVIVLKVSILKLAALSAHVKDKSNGVLCFCTATIDPVVKVIS